MTGLDPRAALLAWCDETERVAREATPGPWSYAKCGDVLAPGWTVANVADPDFGTRHADGIHIARHDPPTVLVQVVAIRAIVALHPRTDADVCRTCGVEDGYWPCTTLLELANGFCPEWREGVR